MTKSQVLPATAKMGSSADSECTSLFNQTAQADTFVEIDSHRFKELVQKLTGVSEDSKGGKLPVTIRARNSSKSRVEAGNKSDGNCCALMKSGMEVGIPPQKSGFKPRRRRQFQKKLEIELGLNNFVRSPTTLPALVSSPITPLGPANPFTCPSRNYCYSSSPHTSCDQSSYLEEELCLEDSAMSVKREPELLPLFPLHSSTQTNL